jgi:hypothetical protein
MGLRSFARETLEHLTDEFDAADGFDFVSGISRGFAAQISDEFFQLAVFFIKIAFGCRCRAAEGFQFGEEFFVFIAEFIGGVFRGLRLVLFIGVGAGTGDSL